MRLSEFASKRKARLTRRAADLFASLRAGSAQLRELEFIIDDWRAGEW